MAAGLLGAHFCKLGERLGVVLVVGWSAGWPVVLVHVQVAVTEERILLGSMPADSLQPGDEVDGVLLQSVDYGEGSGILGDRGDLQACRVHHGWCSRRES